MFVGILAVARNKADSGRYPFPFSIKLGSHDGMNNSKNYFAFVVYWSGRVAPEEAGVKKEPEELK